MASYCCAPCKALCACCGKSGCGLGDCCCPTGNKPNCFFFGFTSFFAIAPMIACLTVAITSFSGSGCFTHNQTNLGIFLLIDALFYFLFILFAWRVQRVLAKPYDKTAKEPGCCSPEVWSRVWQFMWKDISFLIFLIVAGCAIAWNVIGLFWANLVDEANRYSSRTICYVGMVRMARASAGIMFSFLALLPFAFLIAVLLETASTRRRRQAAAADMEAGGVTAPAAAGPSAGTTQPQVAPSAGMHQAAAAMSQATAKTDAKVPSPPPAPQAPPPAPIASGPAIGYPVATHTPGIYPPIPTSAATPASRDVPTPSAAPSAAPPAPPAAAPTKESAAKEAAKDAAKAAGHAVAEVGKSLAHGISGLLHKKDKPAADAAEAGAPKQ